MEWLVIDEKYLDYLRQEDSRIPKSNYGKDKYKPFFGTLFETEEFYYVTQISHAQPRHIKLKENLDFKKIYDPKDNHLIAVVNLNYMFPILKSDKVELKYKDIYLHRDFKNDEEKSKYKRPECHIAKRCIDFKKMEIAAQRYKGDNNVRQNG